ncbi:hypothetical protein JX266_013234 [Neoarthrinium moseri]|uniref:uncharacterized protein n=1 Tax=Neoarthrinium moseri TaxID=1658444 RepID=UPI001FDD5C58|nr:uncharacterized protein JN550_006857 [Neoarthrinium moseri]KAI1840570.1 hypothetical protein JX266_013234 [Neoarthrinium moseri]KAI1867716.1 hypothetical protein JN550_006857 [Neoarthrinium moseri]
MVQSFPRREADGGLMLNTASWSDVGFFDNFLDRPGSHSLHAASYEHDVWTSQYHDGHFAMEQPSQLPTILMNHPEDTQTSVPASAQPKPVCPSEATPGLVAIPANSSTAMQLEGRQWYQQQLLDFDVRLSQAVLIDTTASPSKVEQAAVYVLENSSTFLDLVKYLQAGSENNAGRTHEVAGGQGDRRENSTPIANTKDLHENCEDGDVGTPAQLDDKVCSFIPDTATLLQLIVFSMRLTNLHFDLYSGVLRYLRLHVNTTDARPATKTHNLPPLSLSIAGVNLTTHPRFQLQLLLQTGAHYLSSSTYPK